MADGENMDAGNISKLISDDVQENIEGAEETQPQQQTSGDPRKVSHFQVLFSIVYYCSVSLSIVFVNKFILSHSVHQFNFPLSMTLYQIVWSAVLLWIFNVASGMAPMAEKVLGMKPYSFSVQSVKDAMLPSAVFVAMVGLNNFCLYFVDVTLYLVFRSLAISFSIPLTYLLLKKKTPLPSVIAVLVVMGGYIIGSVGGFQNKSLDFQTVLVGMLSGLLSSFFVALNSIVVKKTLHKFDGDFWKFLFYQNFNSMFLFAVVILVKGEVVDVLNFPHFGKWDFLVTMNVSALLGFLIATAYNLLIKSTSPLTKETTATAKACLQPVLGSILFGDKLNILTVIGAIVCIFGSFLYSLSKLLV